MTFELGGLYHVTHLVDDIAAVDRWWHDLFTALPVKRNRDEIARRDASFAVIGDILLEAVSVVDGPGAEQTPLGRFRARFGERMHSIAMFVDDVDRATRDLTERGLALVDVKGDKVSPSDGAPWIWTHPRQTTALFEFAELPDYHWDPRFHPSWSGEFWRDRHPLGIERTSRLTVLVSDLDRAREVYGDALGCAWLHREEVAGERRSDLYAFGPDLVIEALQPLAGGTVEGRQLDANGEGAFGFTFQVRDLGRAVTHLEANRQPIARREPRHVLLDPAHAFGLGVGFTDRLIPNDHRDRPLPTSAPRPAAHTPHTSTANIKESRS